MIISGAQLTILLTVLGMGGAGIIALLRMGRIAGRFEHIAEQQAKEITALKTAVDKLATVVTEVALQHQRQDIFDQRQNRLEEEMKELRKGEGWILPHDMITRLARMEDREKEKDKS